MKKKEVMEKVKTEMFPFSNHILKKKEEYVKEHYLTMLCAVAHADNQLRAEEIRFLEFLIKGIELNYDISRYITKASDFNKEMVIEFVRCIKTEKLEKYFILDGLILSKIDSEFNENEVSLLAELAEIMELNTKEVTNIAELALGILEMDIKKINTKIKEINNILIPHIEHYLKGIKNVKITADFITLPDITDKFGKNKMVFVEAEGNFFYMEEETKNKVNFTYDFYIGKYQVTQKEYVDIMGNNPSNWKGDNLPVEKVTWWDAIKYCNELNKKEGLPKAYNESTGDLLDENGIVTADIKKVKGYRLATEAEWEYAAKGGSKSKGYIYSGSNDVNEVAWYSGNSGSRTHNVGEKKPNELGIYDMSGNVWEWCTDWYGAYMGDATDPYMGNKASDRVVRGGSWDDDAEYVRAADSLLNTPDDSLSDLGFRLSRRF